MGAGDLRHRRVRVPDGLWSVAGKIVVATEVESRTLDFRTSVDGVSWLTNRSSPAIRDYGASAVIDDRLWFALRIAGLQEDRLEIGYPVWAGEGANLQWKTKGAVAGVMPDWVAALGRIGDTWMMSAGTDGDQDGRLELWASDDAIHWSTIKVAGAESVGINHLQQFGSYLVGLGQLQAEGDAPISVRTKDGRHWTTMPFPGPSGSTAIYGMACGTSACVAVGSTSAIGVERPAVWSTTDGLEWRAVATDLTDARSEGFLSMIVATPAGFIAMGAPNQEALLSRDGTTWQSVRVLPESTSVQLFQLVVTGNVVFAFGEPSAFAGANQWIGDLGTLPFP